MSANYLRRIMMKEKMKASVAYSTVAKSVALVALSVIAVLAATSAQARPIYVQDVQYVQVTPQVAIAQPRVVAQRPVRSVKVRPVQARPVYVRPVAVQLIVIDGPRYSPGRIYYINGRAYVNGHRYYGKRGHRHGHGHGHHRSYQHGQR
jgi:hypothetical protein